MEAEDEEMLERRIGWSSLSAVVFDAVEVETAAAFFSSLSRRN